MIELTGFIAVAANLGALGLALIPYAIFIYIICAALSKK